VIEKSTGQVLLTSNRASFTEQDHQVTTVTDVVKKPDSLEATLLLSGTSEEAKLILRFTKPEIVQMTLTYEGHDCESIYQGFEDPGDHYYGAWEYPFGGSVDNRGAYQEFAVYLPAGRWMNYNDRKAVYDGGVSLTVGATQGTIPLYVREGAIITRGDILKGNNNRGRELGTEVADRGISRPEGWE
jgi:hypothetical protein